MEYIRKNIFLGIVINRKLFSTENIRKIILYFDANNCNVIDLINNKKEFGIYTKSIKEFGFYAKPIYPLNDSLKKLGYNETLTEEDIKEFLNNDLKNSITMDYIKELDKKYNLNDNEDYTSDDFNNHFTTSNIENKPKSKIKIFK